MKKTNKKLLYFLLITIFSAVGIFGYMVYKPIEIIPKTAEIKVDTEPIIVMTDETKTITPIVTSDVELGLVEMPDTKTVLGMTFKASYDVKDFTYTITYISSDESIVTVSEEGLITPISTGKCDIDITSGDITKKVEVIVKEYIKPDTMPEKVEVLIDKNIAVIEQPGEFQVLKSEFTVDDTSVAVINKFGEITGINQGTTKLMTTLSNGETATTEIKVLQPVYDIEVSDKSVNAGRTVKINAKLLPEGADYGTSLTYSSSDTSVATVNNNGVITGKKAGSATITVKSEYGVEKTLTVTVKKVVAPAPAPAPSQSSGSSGAQTPSAPSQGSSTPATSGPTVLSDAEIAQIVAAGNARLGDRYWAEANYYSVDENVGTVNKSYDQVYNEVMALVDVTYPVGRVFNIGSTIIVAYS